MPKSRLKNNKPTELELRKAEHIFQLVDCISKVSIIAHEERTETTDFVMDALYDLNATPDQVLVCKR